MGGALTKLLEEATAPVDDKINSMAGEVAAQVNILKKVEAGFKAEYDLFLRDLEDNQKICAAWGEHRKDSLVEITKGHDDLANLGDKVLETAGNMAKSAIGGIEGDGTDLKGSVATVFTDVKDGLQDAMKVFLGSQVGKQKELSMNKFLVQDKNIRIIYVQTYNTTLEASALDGKKKISCYVYMTNSAKVNIFKSDLTTIITELGNSVETIAELRAVLEAEKDLANVLAAVGDGSARRSLAESGTDGGAAAKRTKVADPEAEEKLKKIDAMNDVLDKMVPS